MSLKLSFGAGTGRAPKTFWRVIPCGLPRPQYGLCTSSVNAYYWDIPDSRWAVHKAIQGMFSCWAVWFQFAINIYNIQILHTVIPRYSFEALFAKSILYQCCGVISNLGIFGFLLRRFCLLLDKNCARSWGTWFQHFSRLHYILVRNFDSLISMQTETSW